jgi:hypothetical protein
MDRDAFSAVLRTYSNRDIEWGRFDCVHFGLEASRAAGRKDLLPVLPAYNSPLSAMRAMRSAGFASIADALDAHATPLHPSRAMTGDVVWCADQEPMGAVGVVYGPHALFFGCKTIVRKRLLDKFVWRP